jgi:3-methyladenine DNA glycosylase Tag
MTITRCEWATSDPLYISYHDTGWGTPSRRPSKFPTRAVILPFDLGALVLEHMAAKLRNYSR